MTVAAKKIMQRVDALAKISSERGKITRVFASPAMRLANELVGTWMRTAGMKTWVDAIGNLIGHYDGAKPGAKILLIGSHLDSIPNAGKLDGPLGVILGIACVEHLHRFKRRLPFAIQVVGFSDEEGVRYQTTYLGSKVFAGCFNPKELHRKDGDGISMANAIKQFGGTPARLKSAQYDPKDLLGYIEAHIEQGPVLENKNLALGVVTAIAGQTRARINFTGRAGHAGTTPMALREDALCAAPEFILAAESLARKIPGAVATVGKISAQPGASNVIPGEVHLTLDVRHEKDAVRKSLYSALRKVAFQIARRRKLKTSCDVIHETAAVNCNPNLSRLLGQSVKRRQGKSLLLPSGAGHDAAVMSEITPVAMLFLRCKEGISHHPDESVKLQDVQLAYEVINDFLQSLADKHEMSGGKIMAKLRGNVVKPIL